MRMLLGVNVVKEFGGKYLCLLVKHIEDDDERQRKMETTTQAKPEQEHALRHDLNTKSDSEVKQRYL